MKAPPLAVTDDLISGGNVPHRHVFFSLMRATVTVEMTSLFCLNGIQSACSMTKNTNSSRKRQKAQVEPSILSEKIEISISERNRSTG